MEDPIFPDARPNDLVIPIMGPPGVGKSTFVNSLGACEQVEVGHGLRSCTELLKPVVLNPTEGSFKNRRLVVVDTPPFNSTSIPDSKILERIAVWLASSYKGGMKLAGIIYLFEAPQAPMSQDNRRDREIFQKLCGNEALSMVVVGTTKWEILDSQAAQNRVQELKDVFWDGPTKKKSPIYQVRNTQESAWNIIDQLAQNGVGCTILQIQRELVDHGKNINDTEAGRTVHRMKPAGNLAILRRVWRILMYRGHPSLQALTQKSGDSST